MLDLRFICDNRDKVEKGLKDRGSKISLDKIIELDAERREIIAKVDERKHERNEGSKKVGKQRTEDKHYLSKVVAEMKKVSSKIKELDKELKEKEAELKSLLLEIPNIPDASVPVGRNATDNKVIKEIPVTKTFSFKPRDHADIAEALGILDIATAVKLAESRFVMLKGKGALLERALTRFMLDIQIKNGYLEVIPPFLVNAKAMTGTGQLPKFEEELYRCRDDELYLIPTAEVPLTNIHSGQILAENSLPVQYVAYTPCFRREAGTYGKDTKGLIRNHQFNKVEIVKLARPENSFEQLESLLANAEEVLQLLEIPYRIVLLCTGDMGFSAAKTYDIEVWMPGENNWREISSCSNFTDFQARRMNIKYRKDNKTAFVHTLNGSGLAVGRTFAALLENYQKEDGTVEIPAALQPYMNGMQLLDAQN